MARAAVRIAFVAFASADASIRGLDASTSASASASVANPIRKVVNMLEVMKQKVTEEGEREKALYDKFMCYCKNGGESLAAGISAANVKIPRLESEIQEAESQRVQLQEDLKQHQADRSAAKSAMEEATALRRKDAAAFAKEETTLSTNIDALGKAIGAISNGLAGGFLQTGTAQAVQRIVRSQDMDDSDRQELLAFLSGTQGADYVPQSGEIVGILKQLKDQMQASLNEATTAENNAIADYEELMSAKRKESDVLTRNIEEKSQRVGDTSVRLAQMKNDLEDSRQALDEDTKFQADLKKDCGTKSADWEERSKMRSEELLAIADVIKVLSEDDTLDLFKKTLPTPASSLVQVERSTAALRQRALTAVRAAQQAAAKTSGGPGLDFIAMALKGQKVGLDKVVKMIDNMVSKLKTEQGADDKKRDYCGKEFDKSDDQKKDLERTISQHDLAISEAEEAISVVVDEMKALQDGIKALEVSVKQASEQRKSESAEYQDLMSANSAAKEVLQFAINRLQKFYNPKLYVEPKKATGLLFAQVDAHRQHRHAQADAPPPPPETYGAYSKSSGMSQGVIEMIKLLIADLDKEMTEAKTMEQDSQKDYEENMRDSAEKRQTDQKALTSKGAAKASLEEEMQEHKDTKLSAGKKLGATEAYIIALHGECDWLLKYYQVRKEARANEIDALGNAKAVLRGADFEFLQGRAKGGLRVHRA